MPSSCFRQEVQSFLSVARNEDGASNAPQLLAKNLLIDKVVFDEKYVIVMAKFLNRGGRLGMCGYTERRFGPFRK